MWLCAAIDSLCCASVLADCKQLITKVRINTDLTNVQGPIPNEMGKLEILQQCDQFAETLLKITMDFRIYGYTNRTSSEPYQYYTRFLQLEERNTMASNFYGGGGN